MITYIIAHQPGASQLAPPAERKMIMPRKRRKWRHRPDKYRGGRVIINQIDYSKRDYISPGRLVAWAEWIPHERRGNTRESIRSPV